jgi:ketol-acid reductoisomerase
MATRLFRDSDADLELLAHKRIALIGYGNLGRPFALNLRDSGVTITIGNLEDIYAERARADGFEVLPIDQATQRSDVLVMLVSDEVMPNAYLEMVSPSLKRGDTLAFASGYNIAFGFIEPPSFVDVVMVAPRMVGAGVREGFLSGEGFMSFVGVERDATGHAWETVLALAKGVGSLRAGALGLTFEQEAELDLFVEQGFMAALYYLLNSAASVLVERGYPPEAVCTELYLSGELAYILEKAAQVGLIEQTQAHSLTSQYGVLSHYERFVEPKLRRQMELTLEEIRSGKFAQDWAAEYASGYPHLREYVDRLSRWPMRDMEHRAIRLMARQAPGDPGEDTRPRRGGH